MGKSGNSPADKLKQREVTLQRKLARKIKRMA